MGQKTNTIKAHNKAFKNKRNSNKIKAFGSYETLCFTKSLVLQNRLIFTY